MAHNSQGVAQAGKILKSRQDERRSASIPHASLAAGCKVCLPEVAGAFEGLNEMGSGLAHDELVKPEKPLILRPAQPEIAGF